MFKTQPSKRRPSQVLAQGIPKKLAISVLLKKLHGIHINWQLYADSVGEEAEKKAAMRNKSHGDVKPICPRSKVNSLFFLSSRRGFCRCHAILLLAFTEKIVVTPVLIEDLVVHPEL